MEQGKNPNPFELFTLGEWINQLAERLESNSYWEHIKRCLDWLSHLKEVRGLEFIGVDAALNREKLGRKYYKNDDYLQSRDKVQLEAVLSRWEGRLQEISKGWVLSIPQAHIEIAKLADGVKAFLDEEELNILEPLEEQGFNEAASCLLHNDFTSAEFIALRTAESLLRRWYEKRTGNKLERARWGEVLEELNNQFPKEKRPKELSLLDYLRGRRNEIAHPEAISKSEEATATFLNVIAACKSIKAELLGKKWERVEKHNNCALAR